MPSRKVSAFPAATSAAAAFTSTISRRGPRAPASTALAISRFTCRSPPRRSSAVAVWTAKSAGSRMRASTLPSRISQADVGPVVVISSSPSEPWTTKPRRMPSAAIAPAISSAAWNEGAPMSCAVAPAGLVNGPSRLNTVRILRSTRTGWACFMAVWTAGAKRNPMPTWRMARAVAAGGRSRRMPQASSRSALPHWLEIERLPCLATCTPVPATTKAATVEMLNVSQPSPPVPQVSSRVWPARPASMGTAIRRMARAKPTSSSTVSPFILRAIRKAAICAWLASPRRIICMAASASAAGRFCPATRRFRYGRSGMIYWVFCRLTQAIP